MFKIIFVMCLGVLLGLFLGNKYRGLAFIDRLIYAVILLLLFSIGLSIGNNSDLIQNMDRIGLKALWITLGSMLGCLLLSCGLYHFVFKHKIK